MHAGFWGRIPCSQQSGISCQSGASVGPVCPERRHRDCTRSCAIVERPSRVCRLCPVAAKYASCQGAAPKCSASGIQNHHATVCKRIARRRSDADGTGSVCAGAPAPPLTRTAPVVQTVPAGSPHQGRSPRIGRDADWRSCVRDVAQFTPFVFVFYFVLRGKPR